MNTTDYCCEQCKTTEGATLYDKRVSPLRLCRSCFSSVGGFIEDRQAHSTVEARESVKKPLVIRPVCAVCGLPAEVSTPTVDPVTGESEYACKVIIDPYIAEQVTLVEKHCDVPALRDANGQIKLPGIPGYFCSISCLQQGLFTYGRCAGCTKTLPKKLLRNWYAVNRQGEGVHQYPKFDFCSPECKRDYADRLNIWSANHLLAVLRDHDVPVTLTPEAIHETAMKGRCAYKGCGKGRDVKGNRVRARVLERGDFCSTACRQTSQKAAKEVAARPKAA